MFLGHFGLALAAKRVEPRLSLGTSFAAAQFLDLIWPVLVLAGVERVAADPDNTRVTKLAFESYPWSHSLLMAVVWGAGFAGMLLARRKPLRAALVAAVLVASHWVLDWITHQPDLPITPWSSTVVGLRLWNSYAGTLVVEFGLFFLGLVNYLRTTVARDRKGSVGLAGLAAFLVIVYVASLLAPPKPGTPGAAIAGPALAMWLIVWWGWWVDKHRILRSPSPA
jgi:membrane-bound metal-dependent hydrolase YbcI (DUF457 family)